MDLQIPRADYRVMKDYLASQSEEIAFLFALMDDSGQRLMVKEVKLLTEKDYAHHNWNGLGLADHVRPEIIKHAHANNYVVIEAHAHNGFGWSAQFSLTDMDGLAELVPHMLWRLKGRPYVALVFTENDFDALVWHIVDKPETLSGLRVEDNSTRPTGLSLSAIQKGAYE